MFWVSDGLLQVELSVDGCGDWTWCFENCMSVSGNVLEQLRGKKKLASSKTSTLFNLTNRRHIHYHLNLDVLSAYNSISKKEKKKPWNSWIANLNITMVTPLQIISVLKIVIYLSMFGVNIYNLAPSPLKDFIKLCSDNITRAARWVTGFFSQGPSTVCSFLYNGNQNV